MQGRGFGQQNFPEGDMDVEDTVRWAFDIIDKRRTGFITQNNMITCLAKNDKLDGNPFSNPAAERVEKIFEKFGLGPENTFSLTEFIEAARTDPNLFKEIFYLSIIFPSSPTSSRSASMSVQSSVKAPSIREERRRSTVQSSIVSSRHD